MEKLNIEVRVMLSPSHWGGMTWILQSTAQPVDNGSTNTDAHSKELIETADLVGADVLCITQEASLSNQRSPQLARHRLGLQCPQKRKCFCQPQTRPATDCPVHNQRASEQLKQILHQLQHKPNSTPDDAQRPLVSITIFICRECGPRNTTGH